MSIPVMVSSVLLPFLGGTLQAQETGEGPVQRSMTYVRVFADADGISHFADAEVALDEVENPLASASVLVAAPIATTGVQFSCFADGTFVDWHPAPQRQFYVILSGELELEVADGERRKLGPGSVVLGDATEGRGVRARWRAGSEGACVAVLPLAHR